MHVWFLYHTCILNNGFKKIREQLEGKKIKKKLFMKISKRPSNCGYRFKSKQFF